MAYKALVIKYHPDRNPNCEKSLRAIQAINASYEVLSNPEKRSRHDSWIARQEEKIKAETHQRAQRVRPNTYPSPPREKPKPQPPPQNNTPEKSSEIPIQKNFGCQVALALIPILGMILFILFALQEESRKSTAETSVVQDTPATHSLLNKPKASSSNFAPLLPPKNGETVVKANYTLVIPIEIRNHMGNDTFVKLTDPTSGDDVMMIFVKGAETVKTRVPQGQFILKKAYGKTWYGYDNLFGNETVFTQSKEIISFEKMVDSSLESQLNTLQKNLSITDDKIRDILIATGMSTNQVAYIFDATDSQNGEKRIDRLPPEYWNEILTRINDISLHNTIVHQLNSRNELLSQIINIRNNQENTHKRIINLYTVRDGSRYISEIPASEF